MLRAIEMSDTKVDNTIHIHSLRSLTVSVRACVCATLFSSRSLSVSLHPFSQAGTMMRKTFAPILYDIFHFIQFYWSIRELTTRGKKHGIHSSLCVYVRMWHERENTQMMVIIFECNQTICKCWLLAAAGMQCQKHFHLNMNHRSPVFASSHSHSLAHSYTRLLVRSGRASFRSHSVCIVSIREYMCTCVYNVYGLVALWHAMWLERCWWVWLHSHAI